MELVLADATARYLRSQGHDVRLQTGTDDNSLKNVQRRREEGVPTREFVRRNVARFRELGAPSHCQSMTSWRRAATNDIAWAVEKLWNACAARGDIYKKAYRGLYCVGCEQFYTEGELESGLCPDHRTQPEIVEEENYFFRLERHSTNSTRLDRIGPSEHRSGQVQERSSRIHRWRTSPTSASRDLERAPAIGDYPCPAIRAR